MVFEKVFKIFLRVAVQFCKTRVYHKSSYMRAGKRTRKSFFTNTMEVSKDGLIPTYSVREKSVKDYKATYSGDVANGFAVTNSYVGEKLPQTGQYWWPIVIMAIAGFCFVLLGIYEIGVKKHDKKK